MNLSHHFHSFVEKTRGYAPSLLTHAGYYRLITPSGLQTLVKEVIRKRHDPPQAQEAEQFLHGLTLTAIAHGHPQAQELAQVALLTHHIEFPRDAQKEFSL